jgi:riboflavin biosynthesis pyrimidine reductase
MIPQSTPDGRRVAGTWRIEPLLGAGSPTPARPARGGVLPPALAQRYGSELTIDLRSGGPTIVANFVTTIDGVVAFDTAGRTGGREVSGGFEPDRFLMGLLRATADAVLVGGGTVRSGSGHVWTPDHVHPPSAGDYAAWRGQLGLAAGQPTTVMVTAGGGIAAGHPALHRPDVPVLIVTTDAGAGHLARSPLPRNVEIVVVAGVDGRIDPSSLRSTLADRGFELVVCEGGPTLFGGLVGAGLIDELFLTVAPQIAGRTAGMPRLALVEGVGFEVGSAPWARLSSVMRSGSHLFLRYATTGPQDPS